jgi:hypothetical protein
MQREAGANGKQQMANGKWQMANGKWQIATWQSVCFAGRIGAYYANPF